MLEPNAPSSGSSTRPPRAAEGYLRPRRILGNATDLPITEHAIGTAGQTLTMFSLFALTGFTLSSGIRNLGGITLHRLGSRREVCGVFPNAGKLLTGTVDTGLALMKHVNPYGSYEFPMEAAYARTGSDRCMTRWPLDELSW
ncbi:MAG: transposase [Actinobacteria bacterium]|nr:transposase [Actinomycetota bacterium]